MFGAEFTKDRISIKLHDEVVASLDPASVINTFDGEEKIDKPVVTGFSREETDGASRYVWTASSEIWDKLEYVAEDHGDRVEYYIRVFGNGDVDSVKYFKGSCGSDYEFDRGFTPIPTVDGAEQCEFSSQRTHDEFSFLTIPPMFVYVFDTAGISEKCAFALAADRGRHNFTKFAYKTDFVKYRRGFWFETDECGHTKVDGEWTSPRVLIYGAADRDAALSRYAKYYFENGIADKKENTEYPRFWYGPICCGWIEQAAYPAAKGLSYGQMDMAREELYDNFNAELDRRGLHPSLMIIDDKWQTAYGDPCADTEKWPDLRGWIDKNRAERGRHTMLWYKMWASEGLPDDECMASSSEYQRRVADPTNPKYRARLKDIMHRLLSSDEGCYNADGLKLDFAFFQPTGREAVSCGGLYGVELFLEYIKTIYAFAKEAKPDCVISASPCHPLFAAHVDHARLHDYHPDLRRCPEEFAFRKKLYETAMPYSLIDTDGAAYRTHRDTMRYLLAAPSLGIPDLYCITDMPGLHLTDDDWKAVADAWREYEKRI